MLATGGRRFDPASGSPDSSENAVSPNLVAGNERTTSVANARGTTSDLEGRRFDSGRGFGPVAQRLEHQAVSHPIVATTGYKDPRP